MDDSIEWHRVVIPVITGSNAYAEQLAWCKQHCGAGSDSWDVDSAWVPVDIHVSNLVTEFRFRNREAAVLFELIYG